MNAPVFVDESISVEASLAGDALHPRQISWNGQTYHVVSVGRQWEEAGLKHILVEVADGSRMDLILYTDLTWQLHRYWASSNLA